MLAANGKITMRQLQILIILSAMGTGVIVLPRRVAEVAGQDGWIIVAGLIALALAFGVLISAAVTAAAKHRPGAGFIELAGYLLSRPVAYICGIALWLKLVFSAGLELRVFMEITQAVMLPQTPLPAVSVAVLLVCAYAAAKGMEARARVAEVFFAIMALPFVFLIALAFFDTNFSNLQPVLVTPAQDLTRGILRLGFIFTGLECLLLVSPFVRKGRHMGRHVAAALAFAGAVILLITVLTIAKFGPGVANQPWPVLRMMDMLNIPGSFIERQEALMFSFWIITAFAIGNTMLFFGGLLVKDMFKPKAKHQGVIVTMGAVFAVSVFPWGDVYPVLDFIYMTGGVFFMVVLPVVLLVAAKLRGGDRAWQKGRPYTGKSYDKPRQPARRTVLRAPITVAPTRPSLRGCFSRSNPRFARSLDCFARLAMTGKLLTIIFLTLPLTGCWDRIEIENRAFVVSIGIDKQDEKYAVSLNIPLYKKNGDSDDEDNHHIKTATGKTISEALKNLDAKTDKTLYYGQAKLLVLGRDLLSDSKMTASVVNTLIHKNEIDLRINVFATAGQAQDILEAKPPGESLPGLFVADIYRNKSKLGGASFALDLERLTSSYLDGAIIPKIKKDDSKEQESPITLYGAVVIKHSRQIGTLSPEELQGFLWCKSRGNNGAVVTLTLDGHNIPAKIEKHSTKVSFICTGEHMRATVTINAKAKLEEPLPEDVNIRKVQYKLEATIAKELQTTAEKLQNEYALDGYDWLDLLRRKNYELYKLHADNWHDIFPTIEIVPRVAVEII